MRRFNSSLGSSLGWNTHWLHAEVDVEAFASRTLLKADNHHSIARSFPVVLA
jgi:hypothetical protein